MQAIEVCPIISDVCCFSKFREKNTEVFNNITTKLVRWQGRRYQQAFIATREDCRQTTMLDNKQTNLLIFSKVTLPTEPSY